MGGSETAPKQKFDINLFNKVFEEHKIPDFYQQSGNDIWTADNDGDMNDDCAATAILKTPIEPKAVVPTGLGAELYYDLGAGGLNDFSDPAGAHFTDYRVAYSAANIRKDEYEHAVDSLQFSENNKVSLDAVQRKRESTYESYVPADGAAYEAQKQKQHAADMKRMATLQKQDGTWAAHFAKVSRICN